VQRVLAAETAILVHFQLVWSVLLVLDGVVVPLLAFGTSKSDLYAHYGTSIASLYDLTELKTGMFACKINPLCRQVVIIYHIAKLGSI